VLLSTWTFAWYVSRAALVPARIDRLELDDAVGARDLRAAEKALVAGALESRIDAERVAVPDVDHGVPQSLAGVRVAHPDRQPQRRAVAVLADVAADRVRIEVVRALGLLHGQGARRRVAEQRGGVGAGLRLRLDGRRSAVGGRDVPFPVTAGVATRGQQRAEAHGAEGGERAAAVEGAGHGEGP